MNRFALPPGVVNVRRTARPPVLLIFAVFLFVVLCAFYVIWQRYEPTAQSAVSPARTTPTRPSANDQELEDVANHLAHIRASLNRSSESARRVQKRIRIVSPALERDYLESERRQMQIAEQDCEAIVRDAALAMDELMLAETNLNKGEK